MACTYCIEILFLIKYIIIKFIHVNQIEVRSNEVLLIFEA